MRRDQATSRPSASAPTMTTELLKSGLDLAYRAVRRNPRRPRPQNEDVRVTSSGFQEDSLVEASVRCPSGLIQALTNHSTGRSTLTPSPHSEQMNASMIV